MAPTKITQKPRKNAGKSLRKAVKKSCLVAKPTHTGRKPSPQNVNWDKFLLTLEQTGNVSAAARSINVTNASAYMRRDSHPEFAEAWKAAKVRSVDSLEAEARRRAVIGCSEPVYQQGELVGHKQRYSDTLLIFLLKAERPDKFGDRVNVGADSTVLGLLALAAKSKPS